MILARVDIATKALREDTDERCIAMRTMSVPELAKTNGDLDASARVRCRRRAAIIVAVRAIVRHQVAANHSLVARDMSNRRSVDEGRRLLVGAVVVGHHRRRGTVALGAVVREVSVEVARAVATASIAVEVSTTARGRMTVIDVDTIAETIKIKTKTTTETAGTVEPRTTNLAGAAATAR